MSDSLSRSQTGAPQMMADALLRSVAGTTATLRVTGAMIDTGQSEMGLLSTSFAEIELSPAVMRKIRQSQQDASSQQYELLVSATSVAQQVRTYQLDSAQSLFAMTLAITVSERDYLIESIASNEAFGQVYLYRLLLREASQQNL